MSKTAITSPELTPPVGPFSDGDRSRWFPPLQRTGRPRPSHRQGGRGGIVAETERVFQNLSSVLKAAGKTFDQLRAPACFSRT
jgi:2-iminobutanoate/2-iminopropanoate deaminase